MTDRFYYRSYASAAPPTAHILLAPTPALSKNMISICQELCGPLRLCLPLQDPVWALVYRSKPAGCTERLCARTTGCGGGGWEEWESRGKGWITTQTIRPAERGKHSPSVTFTPFISATFLTASLVPEHVILFRGSWGGPEATQQQWYLVACQVK